jgi:hypothetical protein
MGGQQQIACVSQQQVMVVMAAATPDHLLSVIIG